MGDNEEIRQGPGWAIALISVIVAVVTLGFNTVVFLVNEQGKLEDKQDYLSEKKADKDDLNRKTAERYTSTMANMAKQCAEEKDAIRERFNNAKLDALRWESKADDCENRWQIHLRVCKCDHEAEKGRK